MKNERQIITNAREIKKNHKIYNKKYILIKFVPSRKSLNTQNLPYLNHAVENVNIYAYDLITKKHNHKEKFEMMRLPCKNCAKLLKN